MQDLFIIEGHLSHFIVWRVWYASLFLGLLGSSLSQPMYSLLSLVLFQFSQWVLAQQVIVSSFCYLIS